ncbi:MAG: hypothetical protein HY718_04380, partial [Planctomycetes bacterium]|nr:hypothetical protein [Planctomycetota bacterium]
MMKKAFVFVAAVALVASSAMAISLSEIAPVGADTASSGRAITSNGIAVGQSGTGTGVIWDGTNLTRTILSSDGAQATVATGVAYRTVSGSPQLVVHGLSAGWSTNWFSNDDGLTWGPKLRSTNVGSAPQLGQSQTMNALGGDDVFYNTWFNTSSGNPLYTEKGTGEPASVARDSKGTTTQSALRSMSGTGRAVGMRKNAAGARQIYIVDYLGNGTGSAYFVNGLDGTFLGEGFAVSGDGTRAYGMSPVSDGRPGNWPSMITNPGGSQTIAELPTFGDTGGSTTNGVVYGASMDGQYASGMNYRGT